MRAILIIALFLVVNANAFFAGASIGDSRLQSENQVYKPSGIVAFSLDAGVFDEPENDIDYSLAVTIRRFGYSHSDGDKSIAFWAIDLKPMIWNFSYRQFFAQTFLSLGYIVSHDYLGDYIEEKYFTGFKPQQIHMGLGVALGYRINKKIWLGLSYEEQAMYYHDSNLNHGDDYGYSMGGLNLTVQYNIF
ncbi:MAG: hypothetical protein MJZ25_03325 [Fibrobacter sp.]|nr:hypothetical protein [Fibrobacter sp.]